MEQNQNLIYCHISLLQNFLHLNTLGKYMNLNRHFAWRKYHIAFEFPKDVDPFLVKTRSNQALVENMLGQINFG